MTKAALDALFVGKAPEVRAIYDKLVRAMAKFGAVAIDPKKKGVHFVRATAFAGAHPKKAWLDLTIRSEAPLKGPRIRAQEQVSKNRWHQDVRLASPKDIDAELVAWLKAAYALAGEKKKC